MNIIKDFTIIAHNDCDGILSSVLVYKYLKNSKLIFTTPYSIKRILLSNILKLNNKTKNISLYVLDICPSYETLVLSSLFKQAYWIDHHEHEKFYFKPKNVKIFWQKQDSCVSTLINFLIKNGIKINENINLIKKIANEIDTNNIKEEKARIFRSFIGWNKWKYKGSVFSLEIEKIVKEICDEGIEKFLEKKEIEKKSLEYEKYLNEKWKEIEKKIEYKLINKVKIAYLFLHESFPVYYISEKLKNIVDILCVCFKLENIKFELRSFNNINLLEIAKKFNGGGHKNACGGVIDMEKDEFLKKFEEAIYKLNL